MLLPILEMTVSNGAENSSRIKQSIEYVLSLIGLQPTLIVLLSSIVFVMTIKAVLLLIAGRHVGYTTAHIATDLRLSLIRSLIKARWNYFIKHPLGSFANALATEAERASNAYVISCRILAVVIQITIYTAIAFALSKEVTIAALVVGFFMFILLHGFVSWSRRAGAMQTKFLKSVTSHLVEGLMSIKPLKAMACESRLEQLLESEILKLKKALRNQVFSKEALRTLQEPLIITAMCGGLYMMITWREMEMGMLMVLALLFMRTLQRIGSLQTYYQKVTTAESAYWSIHAIIDSAKDAREAPSGTGRPDLKNNIRFNAVSFSHGNKKILNNVTFTIPARQFTAVIGPSGAGKTTIGDLLTGLILPQSGEIRIDTMLISDASMKKWRQMIGYVPQETTLFHESILANVTLDDPDLTESDVETALRQADLWEFVESLPEGMATIVGERGSKLSGGQRQRISLARALVRKPKLLILDEATTALDPETEMEICKTLQKLRDKITIFAISHQPAITDAADYVWYLTDGQLTQKHGSSPPTAENG